MFSLSWQSGSLQHYFKTHYWCKSLVEHFWYTSLACFALFSLWSIFSGQKQNAHKNQNATFPRNYKRAQAIWMMFWKSNSPLQQIWKTAHCHLRNDTLACQLDFDGDTDVSLLANLDSNKKKRWSTKPLMFKRHMVFDQRCCPRQGGSTKKYWKSVRKWCALIYTVHTLISIIPFDI